MTRPVLTKAEQRLNETYRDVFGNANGQEVLADLSIYASTYDERGNKPTGMDVYAHIQRRLTMKLRAKLAAMDREDPRPKRGPIANLEERHG